MTDQVDYAQVLADLEKRREDIEQAIATIRALAGMGMDGTDTPAGQSGVRNGVSGLRPHMFFGMRAPEAVRTYLTAVKQTRTAAKIASDLIEYGWTSSSDSPANIVRTALVRMARDNEAVQVKGKEWGLVSWFPGLSKSKKAGGTSSEVKAEGERPEKGREKPRSGYRAFIAEKMKSGMTMGDAAAAWRKKQTGGGE